MMVTVTPNPRIKLRWIRFLRGRSLVDESDLPRPFLEKSLQEKGNKPHGQPEYIILEDEGPPELEEAEDDDGYVEDVIRGPMCLCSGSWSICFGTSCW